MNARVTETAAEQTRDASPVELSVHRASAPSPAPADAPDIDDDVAVDRLLHKVRQWGRPALLEEKEEKDDHFSSERTIWDWCGETYDKRPLLCDCKSNAFLRPLALAAPADDMGDPRNCPFIKNYPHRVACEPRCSNCVAPLIVTAATSEQQYTREELDEFCKRLWITPEELDESIRAREEAP